MELWFVDFPGHFSVEAMLPPPLRQKRELLPGRPPAEWFSANETPLTIASIPSKHNIPWEFGFRRGFWESPNRGLETPHRSVGCADHEGLFLGVSMKQGGQRLYGVLRAADRHSILQCAPSRSVSATCSPCQESNDDPCTSRQ